jgi:N-acetylglucosamine-6-phosphate deacetylase
VRLRSERIVTPAGTISGEVIISDGVIVSCEETIPGAASELVIDLGTRWLVPGLIDLHVHGGAGAQCNTADPDEVAAVARFHAGHGTTALLATTVAAPPDELVDTLRAVRQAMNVGGGARVLGAHLEGPFLSPRRPGAMDPSLFVPPDATVWRRLMLAGGGCLAMMTIAPELSQAPRLTAELVEAGVVVSLGHSEGTYDQGVAAVEAGARSATHVFNAMGPFHHRAPGLVGAVLDRPSISCELICDGIHVTAPAARLVHRCKGSAGMHLVTDAIAAAGMPDGTYRLGGVEVLVAAGRCTVASDAAIAGSTLTMDAAVANAVRMLGIGAAEAVAMASTNPARVLGLEDRKGAIAPGMDADLTVLDDALRARGTVIGGDWVAGPGG